MAFMVDLDFGSGQRKGDMTDEHYARCTCIECL